MKERKAINLFFFFLFLISLNSVNADFTIYKETFDSIPDWTYNKTQFEILNLNTANNQIYRITGDNPIWYGYANITSDPLTPLNRTITWTDNLGFGNKQLVMTFDRDESLKGPWIFMQRFKPYILDNRTRFSFYAKDSDPGPTSRIGFAVFFVTTNNICEFGLNINGGSGLSDTLNQSICKGTLKYTCNVADDYLPPGNMQINYTGRVHAINFTQCPSIDYTQEFNKIFFLPYPSTHSVGIDYNFTIDDINLTILQATTGNLLEQLWNETGNETEGNQLPTGTFKVNTNFCYNDTYFKSDNFTYSIIPDITDIEGDTIYYSTRPTDYRNLYATKKTTFSDPREISSYNVFDTDFIFLNTSHCEDYTDSLSYNILGFFSGIDSCLKRVNGFDYFSISTGSEILYPINPRLSYNSQSDFIFVFPNQIDVTLNFTIYNEIDKTIGNYSITKINDTHINITDKTRFIGTYQLDSYNNGLSYHSLGITTYYYFTNSTFKTTFWKINSSGIFNLVDDVGGNSNPINLIKLSIKPEADLKKSVWLKSAIITSESYLFNLNWTTSLETSYVANLQSRQIDLYYTDNVHKDLGEYSWQSYLFTPQDCLYKTDPVNTTDPNSITPTDFRPDLLIKTTFGVSWRTYLDTMNYTKLAKGMLYFIWLVIFVFAFFSIRDFLTAILIASSLCLIPSLLLSFLEHIITFLVLIAFSMAGFWKFGGK